MSATGVFVDTWGWLALGHRKDAYHLEVKQLYQSIREQGVPIFTSDYVLDEVFTLLFRRESAPEALHFSEGLLAGATLGGLTVERITPARFTMAWHLRKQYKDKPRISFTDLTSIVIMLERGISLVLTQDEHFVQVGRGFSRVPGIAGT
jgi:predicted nucleic acid-binding protein